MTDPTTEARTTPKQFPTTNPKRTTMYNALHAHCITPPRKTPKTPRNHNRPNPPKKKHQSTKNDEEISYLILRARKPLEILYHMSIMFMIMPNRNYCVHATIRSSKFAIEASIFIFYHTLEVSVSDTFLSILSYQVTSQ